ncbi:MAG: preprotein translocase subunit YajC [Planctomycetota bacterium]|jgi:preprotein translocase subunit YajC
MNSLLICLCLLAEESGAEQPPLGSMFIPLMLMAVVFYFLILRPQAKERKKHDQMVSELKKNDRVITAGGIIGTVANVSPDSNEITVKVDDNIRIRVLKSHINVAPAESRDSKDS